MRFAICRAFQGIGKYDLGFPPDTCAQAIYTNSRSSKLYPSDGQRNSELEITRYDSVARVLSGRFHFTGVDSDNDTVRVTDGRFDLKL